LIFKRIYKNGPFGTYFADKCLFGHQMINIRPQSGGDGIQPGWGSNGRARNTPRGELSNLFFIPLITLEFMFDTLILLRRMTG
jgi:hypothetical protein